MVSWAESKTKHKRCWLLAQLIWGVCPLEGCTRPGEMVKQAKEPIVYKVNLCQRGPVINLERDYFCAGNVQSLGCLCVGDLKVWARGSWRDGLQGLGSFPALSRQLITVCNCNSRGFNIHFLASSGQNKQACKNKQIHKQKTNKKQNPKSQTYVHNKINC